MISYCNIRHWSFLGSAFSVCLISALFIPSCDLLTTDEIDRPNAEPLPSTEVVESVVFTHPQIGWVTTIPDSGYGSTLYKTSDGGIRWWKVMDNLHSIHPKLFFLDSYHGWICQDSGWIMRTTNGGVVWEKHQLPTTSRIITGIHFQDRKNGWVAMQDGGVFSSVDGGVSWQQIWQVHGGAFVAINTIDSRTWFGGNDYFGDYPWLVYYDRLKANFTVASTEGLNGPIRTVKFFDSRNGIVGGIGGVFVTQDSGASWESRLRINSIDLVPLGDSIIWCSGSPQLYSGHSIYKSTNRGLTWTIEWSMPSDTLVIIDRLFFLSSNLGWAGGAVYDSNNQYSKPILMKYNGEVWHVQSP